MASAASAKVAANLWGPTNMICVGLLSFMNASRFLLALLSGGRKPTARKSGWGSVGQQTRSVVKRIGPSTRCRAGTGTQSRSLTQRWNVDFGSGQVQKQHCTFCVRKKSKSPGHTDDKLGTRGLIVSTVTKSKPQRMPKKDPGSVHKDA
jgi:hypothetical protein